MKHRKLRITWSVVWGIVAVLLVVLWVRSYSYVDTVICYRGGNWYGLRSEPGHLKATFMHNAGVSNGWFFRSGDPVHDHYDPMTFTWLGNFQSSLVAYCAHWLAAIPFAVLAVAPWIRHLHWRFSIRTLLIATTLVAVGLGLTAWLR